MSFFENRWLTLAARLFLGGFFLYASWHKIADPPDFAKVIYNYKLLPADLIHLFALFLPWVEALAGLALVSGIGLCGGAAAAGLLSLVFIAALSFNLYRGHPTICGCLGTFAEGKSLSDAEKFASMRYDVFRDCGLFLLAAQILFASARNNINQLLAARSTA
jgi:uncharacterized membrane protein YphA (DoxX/SURF4 family)